MSIEIIGYIAGILVAASLLPQVIKSWRTKSTRDIALSWSVINIAGQVLWIVYGFGIASSALIVMSGITLIMAVSLVALKLKHG